LWHVRNPSRPNFGEALQGSTDGRQQCFKSFSLRAEHGRDRLNESISFAHTEMNGTPFAEANQESGLNEA
jgi:hypothetical protein